MARCAVIAILLLVFYPGLALSGPAADEPDAPDSQDIGPAGIAGGVAPGPLGWAKGATNSNNTQSDREEDAAKQEDYERNWRKPMYNPPVRKK